jgi:hypothetical protein
MKGVITAVFVNSSQINAEKRNALLDRSLLTPAITKTGNEIHFHS